MHCADCIGYWRTTTSQRQLNYWPNFPTMIYNVKTPMNGGVSVACWRAGFLICVMQGRPTALSMKLPIPANPYYRAEFHFMPGWIALRFLSDPTTALRHFAKIDQGSSDPIVLARAAYWRGRAFEAAWPIR